MSVTVSKGDIFGLKVDVLVNPVNTTAFMGALAGLFDQLFPEDCEEYKAFATVMEMKCGDIVMTRETNGPAIAHFVTVELPGGSSQIEWIQAGLAELAQRCEESGYSSIAIPAIGCGVGGLDFEAVKAEVIAEFGTSAIDVILLEPRGVA